MKIYKHPQPTNTVLWPELYFIAEADKDEFQDITIVAVENSEYVTVKSDDTNTNNICVGIIAPSLDSEEVLWKALDMVAAALDRLNGSCGVVYFGESFQLTTPTSTSEYLH